MLWLCKKLEEITVVHFESCSFFIIFLIIFYTDENYTLTHTWEKKHGTIDLVSANNANIFFMVSDTSTVTSVVFNRTFLQQGLH